MKSDFMIKSQPDLANWFDNADYTADIFHKLNELNPQIHSFDQKNGKT